jgi:hypothetical protein
VLAVFEQKTGWGILLSIGGSVGHLAEEIPWATAQQLDFDVPQQDLGVVRPHEIPNVT